MHKSIRVQFLFALTAGVLALCPAAFAEAPAAGPAGGLQNMSPEEQSAAREKMREQWQAMSPEERAAKREAMRERWEAMTPEQREAVKKKLQARRNKAAPQQ